MYWEQDPAEGKIKVLGEPDPEVGAIKIIDPDTSDPLCMLFNHAGHPMAWSMQRTWSPATFGFDDAKAV
jgi:hypothetical protein